MGLFSQRSENTYYCCDFSIVCYALMCPLQDFNYKNLLIHLISCCAHWLSGSFFHGNKWGEKSLYQLSCLCSRLYRQILTVWEKCRLVCCSQLQMNMEHACRVFQWSATMVTFWWIVFVSIYRLKWTTSVFLRSAVMLWLRAIAMRKRLVLVN